MKFSIIVPVYNVKDYVKDCLDSIYRQSFEDYEVIVINDGTKDNSAEIVRDFLVNKPKFTFYEQENKGLSATRNVGVSLASGDYLLFLDSDDQLLPDSLQKLSDFLDARPSEITLLTWLDYSQGKRDKLKPYAHHKHFRNFKSTNGKDLIFEMLRKNPDWTLYAWSMCYERAFYLENQLSFVEGLYFEDMIFNWQALLAAKKVACFSEPIVRYLKTRNDSITRQLSKKNIMDRIAVSQYWVDHVDQYQFTKHEKYMFLCRISSLYFSAILFVGLLNHEEQDEVFKALEGPKVLLDYASNALIQSVYLLVKKIGYRRVSKMLGRKVIPFYRI